MPPRACLWPLCWVFSQQTITAANVTALIVQGKLLWRDGSMQSLLSSGGVLPLLDFSSVQWLRPSWTMVHQFGSQLPDTTEVREEKHVTLIHDLMRSFYCHAFLIS